MGKRKREDPVTYSCACCDKVYVQEHSLKRHIKKEHPRCFDKGNKPNYIKAAPEKAPTKAPTKASGGAPRKISIDIPPTPVPVKRGRGRPPKIKTLNDSLANDASTGDTKGKRGPTSPRGSPRASVSPGRSPPYSTPRSQIPVALRASMRDKIVGVWRKLNSDGFAVTTGGRGRGRRTSCGGGAAGGSGSKPPEYVSITDTRELELNLVGRGKIEKTSGGVPLNALYPCLFPQEEDKLMWYCDGCGCFHALTSNAVICPFQKRHGWRVVDVPADGDCFYYCVQHCLASDLSLCTGRRNVTVRQLRAWVAEQCGADQFEFYQIQAMASPRDPHLHFIRDSLKAGIGAKAPLATPSKLKSPTPVTVGVRGNSRALTRSPNPSVTAVAAQRSSLGGAFSSIIASAEAAMISLTNALRTRGGSSSRCESPSSQGSDNGSDCSEDEGSSLDDCVSEYEEVVEAEEEEPAPKRSSTRSSRGALAKVSVVSVVELQNYIRREGRVVGQAASMWADSFAYMVVGNVLKLTILMIDMERRRGCLPYRFLHTYNRAEAEATVTNAMLKALVARNNEEEVKGGAVGDNVRYIVLKRTGPAGHFQYIEDGTSGCACFSADRLPDVFRSLWGVR